MTLPSVRLGRSEDASACAAILNAWIDGTEWMPRVHARSDVDRHYRAFVFQRRKVWVAGDPPEGFLALDDAAGVVTALYAQAPGRGVGKALLDQAKAGRNALSLWTFVANGRARQFYAREGFAEVEETVGDNEEGLPDVRLLWERWPIRRATIEDAGICARIVNDWIDRTDWMPRVHPPKEIGAQVLEALPKREIFLIGEPVEGYLSLNPKTGQVGALYLDNTGQGMGKALMDRAKEGRDFLQLRTAEPNRAAQRFYAREGFKEVQRIPVGSDGLPELHMEWRA
ncbi:GNAT family N-acetyltransferase [Rhodobacteraceae bacterium]|nr:GNAT family N-acetyltransferase [Paracoccaceae bacterium]